MDVLVARERLAQHRLARDVGEDSKLDLAVVRGEEARALLRDERGADPPAERRPHRDRLQVRARGRQPAGGRDRLVDRGVEPSVALVDQLG